MARPSLSNPLGYVVKREYADRSASARILLRERLTYAKSLYRKDLLAHYGCVNAIEFSNKGDLLVSGGDDRRVLIWNVEQAVHGVGKPIAMRAQHISNIFCLGFDSANGKVFSAGNDDQVIVHDAATGDPVDYFLHEQPVYGLSIDPLNDNVFASACDDGRILLYDIREPVSTEPFCLANYTSSFHAVMFNPLEPRILTTANSKEGAGLWDVRKPRQILMKYGNQSISQSCMSVRFNQNGTHILALRRRLPPVLYAVHSPDHLCQFDHPGYYNSCTMKSCCFAGEDDQYVLSGSDDFGLYVWKIPASDEKDQWVDRAHMILRGHRSIVNQVRFNPSSCIIASSGVEKLIKFWSPFSLPESAGSLFKDHETSDNQRKVFTHEEYISLVLRSGQFMSHDYSHQSTKEDPRMMAFFDSLVQREIEGWTTEGSASTELSVRDVAGSGSDSDSALSDTPVTALTAVLVEALEGQGNNNVPEVNGEVSEAQPAESENRISQLIARKRAQLIRLARSHNGEDGETVRPPRKGRSQLVDNSSDSSGSGVEGTTTEENDHKYKNGSVTTNKGDIDYLKGKAGSSSKNRFLDYKNSSEARKRRMKYVLPYSDSSDDEDWNLIQKKRRKTVNWHTDSSDSDLEENSGMSEGTSSVIDSGRSSKHRVKKCVSKGSDSEDTTSDSSYEKPRHQICTRAKRKLSSIRSKRLGYSSIANRVMLKHKGKKHKKKMQNNNVEEDESLLSDSVDHSDCCLKDDMAVPTEHVNQEASVSLKDGVNGEQSKCDVPPATPNGKSCNGSAVYDRETPDSGVGTSRSPFSRPSSSYSSISPQVKSPGGSIPSRANGSSQSEDLRFRTNSSSFQSDVSQSCGSTSRNNADSSSYDGRNNADWLVFQRFKDRVNRVRRNFRKRTSDDSDSN